MSHDSFENAPDITLAEINAGIRRAHQLRSRSVTNFFKKALDRRHRAPERASRQGD